MRNNNQIGMIIGISLIVAVAVSALFLAFSNNVLLGPTLPTVSPTVFTVWGKSCESYGAREIYTGFAATQFTAHVGFDPIVPFSSSVICIDEDAPSVDADPGIETGFISPTVDEKDRLYQNLVCAVCRY